MNLADRRFRSLKPANCLFTLMMVCLVLQAVVSIYSEKMYATEPADSTISFVSTDAETKAEQTKKTMGVTAADCKKCHPSEVAAWMKTVHFQSPDARLYKFEGNTKKYATAMGLTSADLLGDSMCADCHGTKAVRDGQVKVISGVSCEKCHGAAGGEDGWLNRHQSYHASMPIPRSEETPEHRAERLKYCDQAGMKRSSNIYGQSKACFKCHIVGNEKLIAAGHKAASAFDYVSWTGGEVKHNFLVDKTKNAAAPSLWMERTGGTAENRNRVKFVVGTLVQLETALRSRAQATNPAVIPQLSGIIAAANGKLSQINAAAPTPEVQAVINLITPMFGTLFAPLPTDKETYTKAADEVAEQAKLFAKKYDGADFSRLDSIIKRYPPHYSQQYQDKFLKK
ncbi:multiheme c-type cytochrome [uncultured Gimesia sp.]|uniref:multiheme c-type cytochrome n=1 Tax=uncultured Gimesia sp. TaxID=1678688 RepID=UPI0030DC68AA|tara:strand:+ start:144494 stop:145684 length:1191 start_codon:yes stop_codon:yes gene_type:complete